MLKVVVVQRMFIRRKCQKPTNSLFVILPLLSSTYVYNLLLLLDEEWCGFMYMLQFSVPILTSFSDLYQTFVNASQVYSYVSNIKGGR